MTDDKTTETLVTATLNAAQQMIERQGQVVPFGVSIDCGTQAVTMSCFRDDYPDMDWGELLELTAGKLGKIAKNGELIFAIVTTLENGDEKAVGLQLETPDSCKLFAYPYQENAGVVSISEPVPLNSYIAPSVFR